MEIVPRAFRRAELPSSADEMTKLPSCPSRMTHPLEIHYTKWKQRAIACQLGPFIF